MHSCFHIFIYSFLYSYLFISFIHFYHDLAILALSIFLSCRLLLIHIFIYVRIIYANVLIPILCHLLLISIVLIIYAFLSCVPSTFHLIPFWYVYHILISFTYSYNLFLACSIYSFKYIYHIILYSYHIHVSCLLHMALHILIKYDVYEITPHSYILIPL